MRLRRRLCVIICCACAPALLLAACGGGSSGTAQNDSSVPTATLPAKLPDPLVLGNGAIQASGASTYTIKSGDTLAGIASQFGVSLDDLRTANPGINASALTVGATVKLPSGTAAATPPAPPPTNTPAPPPADTPVPPPADTPAPPPVDTPAPPAATPTAAAAGQTYTVQAGDIPVTIAQKFGITVEALLAANPGLDPRDMHVGDVVNIPPPA